MSIYKSNRLTTTPALLWRRFQYWRAMRMLSRVVALKHEAEGLFARANKLMSRHVQPPMPLFDFDSEGR